MSLAAVSALLLAFALPAVASERAAIDERIAPLRSEIGVVLSESVSPEQVTELMQRLEQLVESYATAVYDGDDQMVELGLEGYLDREFFGTVEALDSVSPEGVPLATHKRALTGLLHDWAALELEQISR